jgi:hypothetical protein
MNDEKTSSLGFDPSFFAYVKCAPLCRGCRSSRHVSAWCVQYEYEGVLNLVALAKNKGVTKFVLVSTPPKKTQVGTCIQLPVSQSAAHQKGLSLAVLSRLWSLSNWWL